MLPRTITITLLISLYGVESELPQRRQATLSQPERALCSVAGLEMINAPRMKSTGNYWQSMAI